jgi:hypothetical protein
VGRRLSAPAGRALRFRAGPSAYREIRTHGFEPALVQTLAGASGGAKWLVLSRLDRVLIERLILPRAAPLHLIGSSVGAWRFACYGRRDPLAALARFEEAYVEQRYSARPTRGEITARSGEILGLLLGEHGVAEILAHPWLRTHVITARCRRLTATEQPQLLLAALALAAAANAVSRRALGAFFVRTLFHDPRARPPLLDPHDLPTEHVPLTADNLRESIVASGAIPLVLEAVHDIAGAQRGVYRDGGIIDYHFDAELAEPGRIALFPHFYGHAAPGWFDKHWPHRRALPRSLERVLLVHPSEEFLAGLPDGRIPDRGDFLRFDDATRLRRWRAVIADCGRLADELAAALDGDLPAQVEAL